MTSKTKNSDLTREEEIALVQKSLTPYWFNSPPLFFIHREEDRLVILPLIEEVVQKKWVFLFFDPTTFAGESVLIYAKELDRRYYVHGVRVGIVYYSPYFFLKVKRHIHEWMSQLSTSLPLVFDFDDELKEIFQLNAQPLAVLFDQGKKVAQTLAGSWLPEIESHVQHLLRQNDPGLALFPVLSPIQGVSVDVKRVELGFATPAGEAAQYLGVSFQELDSTTRFSVHLPEVQTGSVSVQKREQVRLQGQWGQDWERIWTSDPQAVLEFDSLSECIAVLAQPLAGEPGDVCWVEVELNGHRVSSEYFGKDLGLSETGDAFLKVSSARLFHILRDLPAERFTVTLKFPQANQFPIALYGIRFGIS